MAIEFAKDRLNKFYNPKLYKPPAEFAQVRAHRDAPPTPPEDVQTSGKKTKESNGIIAMMDSLIKDLSRNKSKKGRLGPLALGPEKLVLSDRVKSLPAHELHDWEGSSAWALVNERRQ